MNPVVKKVSQVVLGFGLLFAAALAFQNCSGYQMYDAQKNVDISSTCVGANCGSQSVSGVSLKLTNTTLSINDSDLPAAPNRVVDVAGYCDDGDFADSDIQYQLLLGSNSVSSWQSRGVKCDDLGRFQIRVDVPTISASTLYTLMIRLAIPVGGGQYLLNPAAQKSLDLAITK